MKLVSIIISAYNCEAYVEDALKSILNQTYQHFEVLIADDGSTDNTKNIINSVNDERIKVHHNTQNIGYMRTWNKLYPLAKGDYITWQDADDYSYPKRLEKLVAAMNADPDLSLCGSNFCRPYNSWKSITTSNYPLEHNELLNLINLRKKIPFPGTRSIFRREVLEEVGPFREYFHNKGWEDLDLICRVAEKYKVGNIKDVLYEWRYLPQSASKIKLNSIDIEKLFIHEIGFFLADQRRTNNGLDGLMPGGDEVKLKNFLKQKENQLLADPSIPIRRIVQNKCSNKDFLTALLLIPRSIASNPRNIKNWKLFYDLTKSFFRSVGGYLIQSVTGNYSRQLISYNRRS